MCTHTQTIRSSDVTDHTSWTHTRWCQTVNFTVSNWVCAQTQTIRSFDVTDHTSWAYTGWCQTVDITDCRESDQSHPELVCRSEAVRVCSSLSVCRSEAVRVCSSLSASICILNRYCHASNFCMQLVFANRNFFWFVRALFRCVCHWELSTVCAADFSSWFKGYFFATRGLHRSAHASKLKNTNFGIYKTYESEWQTKMCSFTSQYCYELCILRLHVCDYAWKSTKVCQDTCVIGCSLPRLEQKQEKERLYVRNLFFHLPNMTFMEEADWSWGMSTTKVYVKFCPSFFLVLSQNVLDTLSALHTAVLPLHFNRGPAPPTLCKEQPVTLQLSSQTVLYCTQTANGSSLGALTTARDPWHAAVNEVWHQNLIRWCHNTTWWHHNMMWWRHSIAQWCCNVNGPASFPFQLCKNVLIVHTGCVNFCHHSPAEDNLFTTARLLGILSPATFVANTLHEYLLPG